jgi:predicted MFS family arabinose efflux permease
MIATLRNKNFSLLWTAGLISIIGNWMLLAALPFYVYELTGSALATSGLLIAYFLPGILFSSIAGVFVDRWDRRRTMIVINLLQAMVIPILLLVQSPEWVWLVYVVAFVESSLSYFFSPAENALLPNLVDEELLISANSLNTLNDNLARIIGPAIGGALLGVIGFSSVIVADAISYLAAAMLIILIAMPKGAQTAVSTESTSKTKEKIAQVWRELVDGLRIVKQNQILRKAFLIIGIALFGDAILSTVMVVFVQDNMGLTAVEFGWIMAARGIGGLIGGLLIAQLGQKFSTTQLTTGGLLISGAILLVIVNIPILYVALPLLVLAGIPLIAWIVSLQTILQQATEDKYRGRVFGSFGMISAMLMAVGAGIGGGLTDFTGAVILMTIASLIFMFSGLLAWILLRKPAEQFNATMNQAEAGS